MPHNALEWHVFVQMNVTRIWFAGYINDGTAAGIYALRRLKFKRCGELASRLSSRLTFAWVGVAILAIHSSRCITAGLLVYFIQMGAYQRACSCITSRR